MYHFEPFHQLLIIFDGVTLTTLRGWWFIENRNEGIPTTPLQQTGAHDKQRIYNSHCHLLDHAEKHNIVILLGAYTML